MRRGKVGIVISYVSTRAARHVCGGWGVDLAVSANVLPVKRFVAGVVVRLVLQPTKFGKCTHLPNSKTVFHDSSLYIELNL